MRRLSLVTCICLAVSCGGSGGSSPTTPSSTTTTPTTPVVTAKAAISASFVSIDGVKTTSGYRYTILVKVQETGGVAATVSAIDFTCFVNGTSQNTFHFDSPFAAKIAASSTATSKSLAYSDDSTGHSYCSTLDAKLAFVDDGQFSGTATATSSTTPLPAAPVISLFTANYVTINYRDSTTLQWSVTNVSNISISGIGTVSASGSQSVTPLNSTTYTLTATNNGGTATQSKTIEVILPGGSCPASSYVTGATAVCNDGTTSSSQNRTGTCSSHGGVRCWICPGVLCGG